MSKSKRFTAQEAATKLMEDSSEDDSEIEIRSSESESCDESQIVGDISTSEDNSANESEDLSQSATSIMEVDSIENSGDHERLYTARNGKVFSSIPPPTSRTRAANIFTQKSGLKVSITNKLDAFEAFFTTQMFEIVVRETNAHGRRHGNDWSDTDIIEIRGFVGLMYLIGISKGNHENVKDMWEVGPFNRPIFAASMSRNRFENILRHLRFDSRDTRSERRRADKFAPFREFWNCFTEQAKSAYTPGEFVCVDEQLVPFRGRCAFRQYLPSKPDKYGLKIFMLVDCETGYVHSAIPYLGKENNTIATNLAQKTVLKLATDLLHSGRNITADNYFTSFELAQALLNKRTIYVGTIRKKTRHSIGVQSEKKRGSSNVWL